MKKPIKKYNILINIIIVAILTSMNVSCEDTLEIEEFGYITGQIRDAVTDAPISGVALSTNPASNSVISDENGNFLIKDVPVGEVTVTAKKLDYKTFTVNVKIQSETETITTILLERAANYGVPSGNFIKSIPVAGTIDVTVEDTLHWQFIPDREVDSLKYNVRLYESPLTKPVFEFLEITDTFAVAKGLRYNTTYYWQVSAVVDDTAFAKSDLWSFTTEEFPESPIIFARRINDNFDIYLTDTSGVSLTQLTYDDSNIDWNPRVNPITGNIAFVSNRNFNQQIFSMNDQGEDVMKITALPITGNYNQGTGFCWSPDGSKLLYPHYDKLYKINRDGTGLEQIATAPEGRHFTSCDWSNYTYKIVVQTTGNNPFDNEIYIMNENGSEMTLLIDNLPGTIQNPVFSIDGLKVMYTRDLSGLDSWDGRQLDSHIFIRDLNDTIEIDLSDQKAEGTNDFMPRYSPDGSKIIFVNTSNVPGSKHSLFISDVEGNFRNLVLDDATMPEWRKTGIVKK